MPERIGMAADANVKFAVRLLLRGKHPELRAGSSIQPRAMPAWLQGINDHVAVLHRCIARDDARELESRRVGPDLLWIGAAQLLEGERDEQSREWLVGLKWLLGSRVDELLPVLRQLVNARQKSSVIWRQRSQCLTDSRSSLSE